MDPLPFEHRQRAREPLRRICTGIPGRMIIDNRGKPCYDKNDKSTAEETGVEVERGRFHGKKSSVSACR